MAEVTALLAERRMVTVTGPGGMGKTRLAVEVAGRLAGEFADGAWLVELSAVQDQAFTGAAVAAAVGVQPADSRSVACPLLAALTRRQLLLVLDNCEHVLDAVADLCDLLLPAADDIRVLLTSREPVGVSGEACYRLGPLTVPDPASQPGQESGAAVALFADRARHADSRFTLDEAALPLVAQLVSRLDGMPLAIELAAARVEALGLQQLLERLDSSPQLLASKDRTAPARHRSLAATVEWSYRLLDGEAERVFRWLSIFPGPFTLDAAAAVAGSGAEPAVLDLVDCSLLSPPVPGADATMRYSMFQAIRAFGLSRLAESGEQDAASAALASWAVSVAEQSAAGMRTVDELAAIRQLNADDASIHQALSWALDHDHDTALRLAVALAERWLHSGRGQAGRDVLVTAASQAAPGSDAWCRAQFWIGDIGPAAQSVVHETAACQVLSQQPPSPLLTELLAGRSRTLTYLGQIPEAIRDAREALTAARQIGYRAGEVLALAQLSRTAQYSGDAPAALEWARQAQKLLAGGDLEWTIRFTGHFLTTVLMDSGDLTAARQSAEASLAWAQETGDLLRQASCHVILTDLGVRAGDTTQACGHLQQAIRIAAQTGDPYQLIICLDPCGHVCATRDQWADAVTIWAAFQARLQAEGMADMPAAEQLRQQPLAEAARALGPGAMQAAHQRGAAMTLQTATEYARMLADSSPQPAAPAPAPAGLSHLSPREQELVTLVAQGQTDAQIAGQLYISISTVRSHLDRIRDKTSCRRRADLTRLALQAGFA